MWTLTAEELVSQVKGMRSVEGLGFPAPRVEVRNLLDSPGRDAVGWCEEEKKV